MSFESDDVSASRLVRKNLYRPDPLRRERSGHHASRRASLRGLQQPAPRGHALCAGDVRHAVRPGGLFVRPRARRQDSRVLRHPRVAPARTRRARPLAHVGDRLRQQAHPRGTRPAARLRRLRGRRQPAPRLGLDHGGCRAERRRRHGRRPDDLRPRGHGRRAASRGIVGRKDHRLRRPLHGERRPRRLHDERRRDGLREAIRHRQSCRQRERLARARFRPRLQSARPRRHRAHRLRLDPRQPRLDGLQLHGPAADARGPDQTEREPLRARARPEQLHRRAAGSAAHLAAQHGAIAQLHAGRATHLHHREARAGLLRACPPPAEPRRRRLPPPLLAARDHRLHPGDVRRRAGPQGLRDDLQRPDRAPRGGDHRGIQPVDRRRTSPA